MQPRCATIDARDAARLIETYFNAKDHQRPERMAEAFAPDAIVEMEVASSAVSFPPKQVGREAVTDALVVRFGLSYDNVHSFCLQWPQDGLPGNAFSCDWAVAMTSRADGTVRLGCGRYDWLFSWSGHWRVQGLRIAIAAMEVLPKDEWPAVRAWLRDCPRPWASRGAFLAGMPPHPALAPVRDFLGA